MLKHEGENYLVVKFSCLSLTFLLVLFNKESGGVKFNEHLAQSLCMQIKTFASTKTVQPPLNDPTKFEKQTQCKMLSWSKCESNAGSSCQKFGSPQDSTQCGGGGGSKKVKISIRKNIGDGPVLKKKHGDGNYGEENTEDPYRPEESSKDPYYSEENTKDPYPSEENTEDPYPSEENTRDPYPPEETTENPYPSEENTGDPYPPEETTEDPYPSEENTKDPYPPEETTEDPYPSEENTEDPYPPEEITEDPYPSEENTEDPYNGGGYGYRKGREMPKLEERIVGGRPAEPNEFPHLVRFATPGKGKTFCGGTIIDQRYILSAAHCFHGIKYQKMKVYVGDHSVAKSDKFENLVPFDSLLMHENYKHANYMNDIALIKLSKPLTWTAGVKAALLPTSKTKPTGFGIVTGWGYLDTLKKTGMPDILQKVSLPIVSNAECKKAFAGITDIPETRLCAGFIGVGGKDSCQGDSGGPLVQQKGKDFTLIGVVSAGVECAKKTPGIYTDVAQFKDWISSKMKQMSKG